MDELLERSDIVTLHCPLNQSTKGLIGEHELSMMKSDSYIINCARGPIIDSKALFDALQNNKIAGAGFDVFDTEPPLSIDNPLLGLKNVVVTPHIAYATKEAFLRRADIVTDNILSWNKGQTKNKIV